MGKRIVANMYQDILQAKLEKRKLLAILVDPDKVSLEALPELIAKIKQSPATHLFVGGSSVKENTIDVLVQYFKTELSIPIVLFPGNPSQISNFADAILFLSLLSGRNPDYLIEHHVTAAPILEKTTLEIISTGYILIESGGETAVERVSQTKPLNRINIEYVCHTALAGTYLGNKLIYLEAGSGAKLPVPLEMIHKVSQTIAVPLLVGGGIKTQKEIQDAFQNGADMVVIGTAFENNPNFFNHD
jgi:phosphoglycerol geranylgeranyltransferase